MEKALVASYKGFPVPGERFVYFSIFKLSLFFFIFFRAPSKLPMKPPNVKKCVKHINDLPYVGLSSIRSYLVENLQSNPSGSLSCD